MIYEYVEGIPAIEFKIGDKFVDKYMGRIKEITDIVFISHVKDEKVYILYEFDGDGKYERLENNFAQ